MRQSLLCLPLALLFLASAVPSYAQSDGGDAGEGDAVVVYYDLLRNVEDKNNRYNISLDCSSLTTNASAHIVWKVNNTAIEEVAAIKDRYQLLAAGGVPRAIYTLKDKPREDDYGVYTCEVRAEPGREGPQRAFDVRAKPIARLAANTNVVEGQKLTLTCKIVGKPYPAGVTWLYSNVSEAMENATELVEGGRYTLSNGSEPAVPGAVLAVEPAARSDAGWYQCRVPAGYGAVTLLRVKDMYAALWPFLGICAEVFVLCAVILVYERRRSKPELDDSDTDNHDQKKS